jgi:23S rRNA (guanosine2251-2'-O)-methyltransferase
MPGNSQRRNIRQVSKKTAVKGTGGKGKDTLKGRGKTLPADERPWHKGYSGTEKLPSKTAWKQDKERKAAAAEGRAPKIGKPGTKDTTWGRGSGGKGTPTKRTPAGRGGAPTRSGPRVAPGRKSLTPKDAPELLVGRNPVNEALRAHVPATALYVAQGIDIDERVSEVVRTAGDRGIPILEVSRAELDRLTGGVLHQGIGIQVPPYAYETFDDMLAASIEHPEPLLVALDGVTDPRNLGAVIRSAAAFGAQGIFVPERRAAGITATAWRTSAGAAAGGAGDQHDPGAQAGAVGGLRGRRAGRRRRDGPLPAGGRGRAAGRGGRVGGARSRPARRADVRHAGEHPDRVRGRVAQRVRGSGRGPGRGRPTPGGVTGAAFARRVYRHWPITSSFRDSEAM